MNVQMMADSLKRLNKTQKQMAQELGIRNSRISDMKVDRLKGYKYQRRIARYLGLEQEILFPDNGDENQQSCQH